MLVFSLRIVDVHNVIKESFDLLGSKSIIYTGGV